MPSRMMRDVQIALYDMVTSTTPESNKSLTVIQPPPYLKSAVLTFHTTDDDKNKETGVSWGIFRNDGQQVAGEPMGHNEEFPNRSQKSFTTSNIDPVLGTFNTLQQGLLKIAVDAGKKD